MSSRGSKTGEKKKFQTLPPQSAAAGAAAAASSSTGAGEDSCAVASASTVAPAATSVQSGGSCGRGGYCVGRRLMSHRAVFLGRVFMWCLVPFFCGRDEHSTARAARAPPPGRGKPTKDGRACRAGADAGEEARGAAVPARSAVTGDMFGALLWGEGGALFGIRRGMVLD